MGLGNNNSGGVTFVNVVNGKFTIRVPEGTEGAVTRVLTGGTNKGREVTELQYQNTAQTAMIYSAIIKLQTGNYTKAN